MIIQAFLVLGFVCCALYSFLQRRRSRVVSGLMALTSAAGIYFVIFPDMTTRIAGMLGVGRGADLVLYCWVVVTLVMLLSQQFKIIGLQTMVTDLTREFALRFPREP